MKKLLRLTVFFFLLLVCPAMGAVTLPFSDNFENYFVGQEPPSPWFTLAAGKGVVTDIEAHSGIKSVQVSGGPYWSQTCLVDVGENYPDKIGYETWVKINSQGSSIFIGFFDQFQNMAPQFNAVFFHYNGEVYFYSSDKNYGFQTLLSSRFSIGVWYKVRVEIDFANLKANVYINDVNGVTLVTAEGIQSSPRNATYVLNGQTYNFQLRKVGVEHYNGNPIYFDDFLVFEWEGSPSPPPPPICGGSSLTWAKTYNIGNIDRMLSIQQTADGGYAAVGRINPDSGHMWLVKLDELGEIQWQNGYRGGGDTGGYGFQQTLDEGYIVSGHNGFGNAWVVKLNGTGGVEWQHKFYRVGYTWINSVQQTADGGYVVAGPVGSWDGASGYDIWVAKLGQGGSLLWQRTYSGLSAASWSDYVTTIHETSDGGFILSGQVYLPATGYDGLVLKLDSDGDIVWQRAYGGPNSDRIEGYYGHRIQQTRDGGFVLAANTYSFGAGDRDVWVLKLKENGDIEWEKSYGGRASDFVSSIRQTNDDGYVIAGATQSFGAGASDIWILKVDSKGNIQWQKTYGGDRDEVAYDIRQTSDGGYAAISETLSFGGGWSDALILKLDKNGNVGDCSGLSVIASNASVFDTSATVTDPQISGSGPDMTPQPSSVSVWETHVVPNVLCGVLCNHPPVADGQSVTTDEDTARSITLTASDPDGDPFIFSIVTPPMHGTLSGSAPNVVYTPNPNYNGSDSFTFKVNDGQADSNVATVSITINLANDPPIADQQDVITDEDVSVSITLTASDVDGTIQGYSIVSAPMHGTLSGTAPNMTYTASANYYGPDSFAFKVNDGQRDSNIATVSITVNPLNDAPIANGQAIETNEDTSVNITLTGHDIDGDALSYELVASPTSGTLSGLLPTLTYLPNPNYNGPDSFTFKVKDGKAESNVATVNITVKPVNDAPLASPDNNYITNEDATLTISAPGVLGNDSDVDRDLLRATLVSSTSSGFLILNQDGSFNYRPNANFNGTDSFSYKANDGQADSNVVTVIITVNPVNDAPVAVGQTKETNEDAAISMILTSSDIDEDQPTYSIVTYPSNGTLSGTFPDVVYSPNPNYNGPDRFTFKVNDSQADSNLATVSITVIPMNDMPEVNAGPDAVINEGETFTGSGSFVDPDSDIWTATVDFGDGTGIQPLQLTEKTFAISHVYADNGRYTVMVTVHDGTASGTNTLVVTVNNIAPAVTVESDQTINEGDTASFSGSFTDPVADTHTIVWDFGDGTGTTATLNPSHTYADNGTYFVTLAVTDDDGGRGTDTVTVTVNNVAPTVGLITAPIDPVRNGTEITVSALFTDPGILDTHTATWDWGDGITSVGTVIETYGSGTVQGAHVYAQAGVYNITLTVTDKDRDSGSALFQYVVVYDPEGGFVTGGGWINSPEGAYPSDLSLTGKATFGFVSKYKKGANVPTGTTEFQFKVGNLNFHSESYEWLVVAGAKAQYKGTGTINGNGNYGFMLTAIDADLGGSPDKFRIKIWDKDNEDTLIYDNQLAASDEADPITVIGAGSIVIHKQ